jgi:putative NADPH-quinone reductase
MRILLIDAHPNADSFCNALADAYVEGASAEDGADVQVLRLRDLKFEPVLRQCKPPFQEWEPDLEAAWEDIVAASHICLVYPNWWGGHPALLQGFFERVFLPGKAFKFHEDCNGWDRLLSGRSCDIITTMDTPLLINRLVYRSAGILRVKKTITEFVGLKTRVHVFAGISKSTAAKRAKWLAKAKELGKSSATCNASGGTW